MRVPHAPVRARTTTLPDCAVADEHHVVLARQLACLDDAVGRQHGGAGGDVQPGLDHAVVAEADADAGVRAEQAPFADRDLLLAAARQRAHDRRSAADVAAVADDHAAADATLDHRRAERAGVEVAEALVHHGGAGGEVGTEADPRGVGDAHAGRDHVVGHPRELVDAVHGERAAGEPDREAHVVEVGRPRPGRGRSTRRCSARRRCRRGSASVARRAGATGGAAAGRRPTARPAARRRRSRSAPDGSITRRVSSTVSRMPSCDSISSSGQSSSPNSPQPSQRYQVSSTLSSAAIVARPAPHAIRVITGLLCSSDLRVGGSGRGSLP